MALLHDKRLPMQLFRGLAALTALIPLVSQGGASASLLLAGRVVSHQTTRVQSRLEHFSVELAALPEGTELARISHQTNSGEGFQLLVSDSQGGTLSLDGRDVPYSVEVERAHPVRPGRASQILKAEAGTSRPSVYDYSLRLKIDGHSAAAAAAAFRAPNSPQTLILSIVAL